MTSKQKKGLRGSIDDVLGDLLGDSDDPPMKTRSPAAGLGRSTGVLPSRSGKRSLLDNDDFFSKLAEEAEKDDEGSDVSEADPRALLESMKDIDDMDADLFGGKKKPSSAPAQSKASGSGGSKPAAKAAAEATASHSPEPEARKPSSAPAAPVRGYKKFSFMDDDDGEADEAPPGQQDNMDDPLGDLLDDLDPKEPKSTLSGKTEHRPSSSPAMQKNREEMASPAPTPKKREELTFDDDEDDLMDALGFSDAPKSRGSALASKTESEAPQRARTRLDEILGIGTSPRLLERPSTGEKKHITQPERPAEKPSERSAERQPQKSSSGKDSVFGEEDFTFGSYQPTVVSTPEGRQSRRQSVRFSTEDVSSHSPDRRPKPAPTPSTPTSARSGRPTSDWLGLKQDENEEEEEQKGEVKEPTGAAETLKPPLSPSHGGAGKPPSRGGQTLKPSEELRAAPSSPKTSKPTASRPELNLEEETKDDWLAGALGRKKTPEEREKKQEELLGLGEEIDLDSFLSKRNANSAPRRRQEGAATPRRQPSSESLAIPARQQSPAPAPGPSTQAAHTAAVPQQKSGGDSTVPVQQVALSSTQPQVTLPNDGLQQLLLQQQLAQAQLWGLGGPLELGSLQRQRRDAEQQTAEVASLQAKIIQLEGQVRSLQLEKDQIQMLLDSVQQRQKQDTELMENTHRARIKLLEESASQREARARQENEDLAERLAAVTRMAEQERADLQAQHQRRLAQCQQDRDREVERLRDLQRKSILEMKKDHEEQVQRLRRLKDEEIDAVTSATSQTRSLTVVIEQMEQFSRRLGDLSSRVESTHENTAQGLELGARQRDEQLRVLQDRLTQQQREMAEERARLKEVIAKMDTQLAEQQRQLQQERWRVTAEQAKAESALRGLEEERRSMTQHIALEREELERAKSALLEEQQAVMQRCAEERRKLAAEWTQFHTQEKVRQDRAEREASRAMEREAHREGSIISIAQEQAELKLRAGELKQREDALQRERENLDKLREELEREKEKLSAAALRLKSRAQEVESFSKVASERYEEGERALQEARQVETEHQARLRTIHTEMERLRKQEQSLQQERLSMTDHRREVERLRPSLPVNPLPLNAAPLLPEFSPALATTAPVTVPPPAVSAVSSWVSPELQATLALMRHTAEKDRDFLQDEQFFLDTLKKTPHNSAFHTA
ncbi:fas-binding factor 1 homolog [Salminus brasiliensis]|uniref:fas-binding factor 1 homolog n=1 Tax=Salminus brasiliensis TaxID=930266 RepID=UPI003B82EAED